MRPEAVEHLPGRFGQVLHTQSQGGGDAGVPGVQEVQSVLLVGEFVGEGGQAAVGAGGETGGRDA